MIKKISLFVAIVMVLVVSAILCFGRIGSEQSKYVYYADNGNIETFSSEAQLIEHRRREHQKSIKAIDNAWNNIMTGNLHYQSGAYLEAAKAYEAAYSIGEWAVSGLKLAQTYEKLGRYNDAIEQLNQMIEKRQLSETGVQKAKEMISRLSTKHTVDRTTSAGRR